MRTHRKVWLWWGPWWAVQLYVNRYVSVGIHVDWGKPLVDLHFGWFIVALGRDPVHTPVGEAHRSSCRGFLIDRPVL